MTKFIPFYYDEKGFYQNDKSFMITGNHLAYLTAFLNASSTISRNCKEEHGN